MPWECVKLSRPTGKPAGASAFANHGKLGSQIQVLVMQAFT